MGYTLKIGNAVPHHNKEYGELYASWEVEPRNSDDAPLFPNDEVTGNGNARHPSYSGWSEFCEETGLKALFYDKETGLLRGHPGCFILEPHHHATVADALNRWKRRATKPPGFSAFPVYDEEKRDWITQDEDKYDPQLARLIWLEWWMRWALANCETPAIENY